MFTTSVNSTYQQIDQFKNAVTQLLHDFKSQVETLYKQPYLMQIWNRSSFNYLDLNSIGEFVRSNTLQNQIALIQECISKCHQEFRIGLDQLMHKVSMSQDNQVKFPEVGLDLTNFKYDPNTIQGSVVLKSDICAVAEINHGQVMLNPYIIKVHGDVYKLQFKILKCYEVTIGVTTDSKLADKYSYIQENGYSFSNINVNDNQRPNQMKFTTGDIITCAVDKTTSTIFFQNERTQITTTLTQLPMSQLGLFIYLCKSEVEIINSM